MRQANPSLNALCSFLMKILFLPLSPYLRHIFSIFLLCFLFLCFVWSWFWCLFVCFKFAQPAPQHMDIPEGTPASEESRLDHEGLQTRECLTLEREKSVWRKKHQREADCSPSLLIPHSYLGKRMYRS